MICKKNCKKGLKFPYILTYISVTIKITCHEEPQKIQLNRFCLNHGHLSHLVRNSGCSRLLQLGINGFAGYSVIVYVFMCIVHAFADSALSVKSDDFTENLEEI